MEVANKDLRVAASRLIDAAKVIVRISRQRGSGEVEPKGMYLSKSRGTYQDITFPVAINNHLELAKELYRARRDRVKVFAQDALFGEPAWDMLLDLYIADQEKRKVALTSACIGAVVPTTTGLRWIAVLERDGLILRQEDPDDARRSHVSLSAKGQLAMSTYLGSLEGSFAPRKQNESSRNR